ncbi:MAG: tetratricopeptide repeat protein [Planctomycetota bacterium]
MEKKAKENPSPSTFVDLAQAYINLGWIDHTLRVAREGLLLFPRSESLQKVHRYALMNQLKHRVQELSQQISRSPTPELYRELAEVYNDMGDLGSLIGTCVECLRRFPNDTQTHLIVADARNQAYYRSLRAQDGRSAMDSLLKVLELDPSNLKAHRLIAHLFFRIGAIRQAREHLELLRDLEKSDEESRRMLNQIADQADNDEEPEILLERVETRGALPNRSISALEKQKVVANEEAISGIREGLSRLVQNEGVCKAAYIRGGKALVKGDIRNGRDPFLKTVRVIAKAAQRAVRRMDLGNFSKGIVEGSFGHICICTFGDVSAAVQCASGTRIDDILSDLQELVAGSLFVAGNRED